MRFLKFGFRKIGAGLVVVAAVASLLTLGAVSAASPGSARIVLAADNEDLLSVPITVRGTGDVVRLNIGSVLPETTEFGVQFLNARGDAVFKDTLSVGPEGT